MANESNLDIFIRILTQEVGQQKAEDILKRVKSATTQVKDESQRYQQTLERMAATQERVNKLSKEDADLLEKAAERKRILAERTELAAQADKELADTIKVVSQEEVDAATKSVAETAKVADAKQQLSQAVKGLSLQFPILGRIGRLALNPITGAVAALSAAFLIFRHRVEALKTTLTNFALPAVGRSANDVSALADAYKSLGEAVAEAREKFNSAEGVYQRSIALINEQAEAQKRLLEANKALEISAAKTPAEKAAIEERFAAAGLGVDETAARQRVARLAEEKFNLEVSARQKRAEAEGLNVGFGGAGESEIEALRAQAEEAKREIEMRQARLADLFRWQDRLMGFWEDIKFTFKMAADYGGADSAEAIAMEQSQISVAQQAIDRFEAFKRAQPVNARRTELIQSAAADEARAAEIGMQLPFEEASMNRGIAVNRQVASAQSGVRVNQLASEAANLRGQGEELAAKALADIQSTGRISLRLLEAFRRNQQQITEIERQISAINARIR